MKTLLAFIFLSAGAFANQANAQSPAAPASAGSSRAFADAYSILSSERFAHPTAADKLNMIQGISKLNGIAHPADFSKPGPKSHPALPYLSLDPMKILSRNEVEYRKGDPKRAVYSVRRIMVLCSECHASVNKPIWTSVNPTSSLNQFEWGEFYKFAGRFDEALLHYEKFINTSGYAHSQPALYERAGLNIVALGIEASSNAYTFVGIISNALQATSMTKSQKALFSSWRVTGKAWGSERGAVTKAPDMLTQARQLMTSGDQMNRSMHNSGFVHQARAMLVLKKVMTIGGPAQKARAFFMAGELREKLKIDGVWLHAEDYYEACVRVAPRGADAPKCLAALQKLPSRSLYTLDQDTVRALSGLK